MKKLPIIITVLTLFFLTACISEWDKMLDTDYLDLEISSNTKDLKPDNIDAEIGIYKNNLLINFEFDLPRKFNLPISENEFYKYSSCNFYIGFYNNGKPIITSFLLKSRSYLQTSELYIMKMKTSARILTTDPEYEIEIPLLAFHELKSGPQKIEMRIWQEELCLPFLRQPLDSLTPECIDTTLLDFSIKFKLEIPEIQQILICSDTIVLQNDEEWNPYNMDFSFRSGFPDIYWSLYLNAKDNNDYNNLYFTSDVADYAVEYPYQDTISIFYLKKPENILISVNDRDVLSRDDFIGSWYGSIDTLISDKDYKILKFDHIESFKIKAINKGVYNK
ncbi:MAG: hypothetical protein Kow0068_16920 [Marinilabiliales bacterium]